MYGIDIYCKGKAAAEHPRIMAAELFFYDVPGFEAWSFSQMRRELNSKGQRRKVPPTRVEGGPKAAYNHSKIRFRCLHCGDNFEIGAGKWQLLWPVLDALRETGATELSLSSLRRAYFLASKPA